MHKYQFTIIGSGVVGTWIAFELSKYTTSICILEKENDTCMGTSKANSAIIHAGYDPKPGSLMAKLNVRGNELTRKLADSMDIPFMQVGSLVVATSSEGLSKINELYDRGIENGVEGLRLLDKEETKELEPNISDNCLGSLYAPTAGICSPFEMTTAPLEIALMNGAEFKRKFEVKSVEKVNNVFITTSSSGEKVKTEYVINAAGLYADEVAKLFGDNSIKITARRGEYSVLDSNVGGLVKHVLFQPPTSLGKGILVTPTVDGNILVGPNAIDLNSKDDVDTTTLGQKEIFDGVRNIVPAVDARDTITSFSGNRAISSNEDFIIDFSNVEGLFNVAGICSPGLTSTPAIGEYVAERLIERGYLPSKKRDKFETSRKVVRLSRLTDEERKELIKQNPLYGRIICRCETVSEGEIVDSIRRPAGAVDMDGVKRRTRAGMGRCQSGFCGPKVMEILSRELGIPFEEVTKFGKDSWNTEEKRYGHE